MASEFHLLALSLTKEHHETTHTAGFRNNTAHDLQVRAETVKALGRSEFSGKLFPWSHDILVVFAESVPVPLNHGIIGVLLVAFLKTKVL